jgi:hypothetical protein
LSGDGPSTLTLALSQRERGLQSALSQRERGLQRALDQRERELQRALDQRERELQRALSQTKKEFQDDALAAWVASRARGDERDANDELEIPLESGDAAWTDSRDALDAALEELASRLSRKMVSCSSAPCH